MNLPKMLWILSFFLTLWSGCERSKGFSPKKILSNHPPHPQWATTPLSQEEKEAILPILQKRFSYLGSGNHCYAFASEDRKYVIKFFKQNRMDTTSWYQKILCRKKWKQRKKERKRTFSSYKLAFEHLREESALLYIQLNKKKEFGQQLFLFDQKGNPFVIDSDESEFLLQKQATIGYVHLHQLLSQEDREGIKEALSSLFRLIVTRCKKGLEDRDMQLSKNIGFIGNQAIEIDVGELQKSKREMTPEQIEKELSYIESQLRDWIKEQVPQQTSLLLPLVEQAKTTSLRNF